VNPEPTAVVGSPAPVLDVLAREEDRGRERLLHRQDWFD
jgi:hypothetical protein